MIRYEPASEMEAQEIIQQATGDQTGLRLSGNRTRSSIGRPVDCAAELSSSRLNGVTLYEPAEMIIGAKAGTPISVIEQTLAEKDQALTFEPMDHRALLGSDGEPTIGSVAACNISGPRRIIAGAARDNLVGVRFINGRGEAIKNGGRVMKNVTGLDLVRLLCGSWGTLGFITDVTLKVLPKPAMAATLVCHGLDDTRGIELLCQAMGTPYEINGAAHLPKGRNRSESLTLFRLEGFDEQLRYRCERLIDLFGSFGDIERIDGEEHIRMWADIRDVQALDADADDVVWKVSVKPSAGPLFAEKVRNKRQAAFMFDWSGGLIWLATGDGDDGGAAVIRAAALALGGHATLIRGPQDLRCRVSPFHPPVAALDRINKQIKTSFDPKNLFNPGLMDTV